jgi:hypothetical protein
MPIAYLLTVESALNLRLIVAAIALSAATCELLRASVDAPLSVLDALPSSMDVQPAGDNVKIAISKIRIPELTVLPKGSRDCTQMVSLEHRAASDFGQKAAQLRAPGWWRRPAIPLQSRQPHSIMGRAEPPNKKTGQ